MTMNSNGIHYDHYRYLFQANEAEHSNMALFTSLSGIGISLINQRYQEVAFFSLTSAPAMWEVEVKHKWKQLNIELASWLEEQWRNNETKANLEDYVQVRAS